MHAHSHDHSRVKDRRLLAIALVLIVGLMAGEIAAGIVAGSLALLADAGHMLTDAAALAAALVASRLASRPARGSWTFGLGRAEILAAQANGIALLLVGIWIVYGAVRRLVSPADVHGGIVLVVALVGVAVNLVATLVLSRADRESLNVRGAFLHVATDLAAFAGTAVAGALVLATGWDRFDPIAGLAVAALCLRSSWTLLRESGRIFLEGSPPGIDPDEVARRARGRSRRRRGARPPRVDGDERLPRARGARARLAGDRLPRRAAPAAAAAARPVPPPPRDAAGRPCRAAQPGGGDSIAPWRHLTSPARRRSSPAPRPESGRRPRAR